MNMKYAFMTFSTPELSLAENLTLARDLGYHGLEPRVDCGHKHGVELAATKRQRAEIRQMAEDSGVSLCCVATSIMYLSQPGKVGEQVESTKRFIELAADVGSSRLRVFGSGHGEVTGFSSHNRQQLADTLSQVAEAAAAHSIRLCLETHDYWCDAGDVGAVMKLVDHPMIGVNWDIMHPIRSCGFTVESSYAHLKPWVYHFHMHQGTLNQEKLELLPLSDPSGAYDHEAAIRFLAADGYDGYMSGEWIKWGGAEALGPEIEAIKAIEKKATERQ